MKMELTFHQLFALNAQLPRTYQLQPLYRIETRRICSTQKHSRRSSLHSDASLPRLPEKRPQREKRGPPHEELEAVAQRKDSFKKLQRILLNLKKQPSAKPFLQPVDLRDAPDYYEVIAHPIDLGQVESKLRNGDYETAFHFAMDVRKIWNNSFYYNANDIVLYQMTLEMSLLFEHCIKGNENLVLTDQKEIVQELNNKIRKLNKNIRDARYPQNICEKALSFEEKKSLHERIRQLEPKYLKGLLELVRANTKCQGEELEFDIDTLPPQTCRDLLRYVDCHLPKAPLLEPLFSKYQTDRFPQSISDEDLSDSLFEIDK